MISANNGMPSFPEIAHRPNRLPCEVTIFERLSQLGQGFVGLHLA